MNMINQLVVWIERDGKVAGIVLREDDFNSSSFVRKSKQFLKYGKGRAWEVLSVMDKDDYDKGPF